MIPQPLHVPGGLYADLFATVPAGPEPAVPYEIWNRIYHALPQDYKLPDLPVAGLWLPRR